jgi:hypothetical protein
LDIIRDAIVGIDTPGFLKNADGNRSEAYVSCIGMGRMINGDVFGAAIRDTLNAHTLGVRDITLRQAHEIYGTTFIAVTSELKTFAEPYYISHVNHPDMPVYVAAQISASAPFVVAPTEVDGRVLVDGATVDAYPLRELAKHIPLDECLGILLDQFTVGLSGNCGANANTNLVGAYVHGRAHPWTEMSDAERARTIYVVCEACAGMNMFDVREHEKERAYTEGVMSVESRLSM